MTKSCPLLLSFLAVVALLSVASPARGEDAPATIIIVPMEAEPAVPATTTPEVDAASAAHVEEVDEESEAMLAPIDGASPGVFAIGISGLVGSRDDGRGGLAPTWTAGLDLSLAIVPWLRVVVRRVGYGMARSLVGDRHAVSLSPGVELAIRVAERLEPYVQLGAALQVRFGGEQDRTVGIAPFLDGGLRIYLASWVSLAVEGALHVPVTSGFLLGHEIIPQGGLVFQGGLGVAFHL